MAKESGYCEVCKGRRYMCDSCGLSGCRKEACARCTWRYEKSILGGSWKCKSCGKS